MDKKSINNKTVAAVVRFECFFFSPRLNSGEHEGVFNMEAYHPGRDCYMTTSDIVDIHEIDGVVYVETLNSLYELDGTENIQQLENIKRYLHDKKFSSAEFFHKYVPNRMPTPRGWMVF